MLPALETMNAQGSGEKAVWSDPINMVPLASATDLCLAYGVS
jgi:hypothetical protein